MSNNKDINIKNDQNAYKNNSNEINSNITVFSNFEFSNEHDSTTKLLEKYKIFIERTQNNCSDFGDDIIHKILDNQLNVDAMSIGDTVDQRFNKNNSLSIDWTALEKAFEEATPSGYCEAKWDGVGCWHRTPAGHEAIIPCLSSLNGIPYDTSDNASRLCLTNGSWAEKSNYEGCRVLIEPIEQMNTFYSSHSNNTQNIYYAGYGLSICALTVALWIFLYFKDLRCVRNTIHTNLMITYLLNAICWISIYSIPLSRFLSCYLFVMFTYLWATNFFWMFVEGLYLYILVVKTFSIEFVKIYNYHAIGWGIPAIVVTIWSITKSYLSQSKWRVGECSLQVFDVYDNIYKVPILIVLIVNIFFLGKIMWVLIRKLRNSSSAESKQYRKAAKALLVLIPLLGVGYILILVTPTHPTAGEIFKHLQAILVSTQGFTVAVLYCFCNGEVRNSLRHRIERCRLQRSDNFSNTSSYYRTSAYYLRQNAIQSQKARVSNGVRSNIGPAKRQAFGFKSITHNRSPKSSFSEASTMQTSFTSMASTVVGNGQTHPDIQQRRASETLPGNETEKNASIPGRCSAPETGLTGSGIVNIRNNSTNIATKMYRSHGISTTPASRERRADSCVSFTTNATYVMLTEKNNNSSNNSRDNINANFKRKPFCGTAFSYQSVSDTPDINECVEIEMKMI